jgi:hypothetical protein
MSEADIVDGGNLTIMLFMVYCKRIKMTPGNVMEHALHQEWQEI